MFAERLVTLRKERGLTQQEIADYLKMSRATYAQYEIARREPDFDTLKKLAEFFDCTTDYLLGRSNIRKYEDIVSRAASKVGGDYDSQYPPEAIKILDDLIKYHIEKYMKEDE